MSNICKRPLFNLLSAALALVTSGIVFSMSSASAENIALTDVKEVAEEDSAQEPLSSITLDDVLASVANKQLEDVPFKETQINPLLEGTQESYGILIYDRQDRSLTKSITEPTTMSFSMNDDHVILSQEERTRKISLKRSPELQALFYSIRGLLEGDKTTISQHFDISFTAMGENVWVMELTPKSASTSKKLEVIEIWGADSQVDTISTQSPNGNVQITYLNHPEALEKQELLDQENP